MKQDSLQINDQRVAYTVVHRPRVTRRIHLEINAEGGLLVVAPKRMSRRAINRALQGRAGHVARFLQRARSKQQDLPALRYVNGEKHFLLGEKIPLVVDCQLEKRGKIWKSDGQIHVLAADPTAENVKKLLTRWYRQLAAELFAGRLEYYSALAPWTAGQVPAMRLRRMKRTWGSCSSQGLITLNPHLVKAPPECIDYVVAHEICHIREHNHGRAFYALQEQLYPQWSAVKALLNDRGHTFLHS